MSYSYKGDISIDGAGLVASAVHTLLPTSERSPSGPFQSRSIPYNPFELAELMFTMSGLRAAVDIYFAAFAGIWDGSSNTQRVNSLKTSDCQFIAAPASALASMPAPPDFGSNLNDGWARHIQRQIPVVDTAKIEIYETVIDETARKATAHICWHIVLKNKNSISLENAVFLQFDEKTDKITKVLEFMDTAEAKRYMAMMMEAAQALGLSQQA
jgi:hypothetical protein